MILLSGCARNTESTTEKKHKQRNNIINVSDKIIDIKPEILFGRSELAILDDVLIISEMVPKGEKGIHIFDKNTFKYLTSTGIIGRGPGEIMMPGPIGIDKKNRTFWVPDAGTRCLYKFPLDSVLINDRFKPTSLINLNDKTFLNFVFLNDSIILGETVQMVSKSSFEVVLSKLNINSNTITRFGYEHHQAFDQKAIRFLTLSNKDKIYITCYFKSDLMTICDFEGNLKYNIYGPGWFDTEQDNNSYFFGIDIMEENIVAAYIGGRDLINQGNLTKLNAPKKFLIFGLKGDYIKTIDTGFSFERFCIDSDNKRIIAFFPERGESLGYFNYPFD